MVGESVSHGDSLVTIHAADRRSWDEAAQTVLEAYVIGRPKDVLPAVYEHISGKDLDVSRFRTNLLKTAD